jgi:hypothetical protein
MNKKLKSKWLVDAALLAFFITAFFLDLTGLALHQWIGIAGGAIAAYHLVTNWAWVKAVTGRFLGKMSNRSRLYYLMDTGLFTGFTAIIVTGMVISSWLNLALTSYAAWRTAHVAASLLTLLVILIKIALHWGWIASVANQMFSTHTASQAAKIPLGNAAARITSRREFTRGVAVVGISSMLAFGKGITSFQSSETNETASASTDTSSSLLAGLFQSDQTSTNTSCQVICGRGCSYPGHCRRYTDTNNNNRCDLGECM